MTYRRSPSTPRRVLPQQAIFFQRSGTKIEKPGGVYSLAFFSLLSPPSLKTSPVPGRLTNQSFLCLRGLELGLRFLDNGPGEVQLLFSSQTSSFFHAPFRGSRVDHLLLWYLRFLRWLGKNWLQGAFGSLAQVTRIRPGVVAGKTGFVTRLAS